MQQTKSNIVHQVRAGILTNCGISLNAYCKDHELDGKHIHSYLRGEIRSERAKKQAAQVITAAQIEQPIETN